MADWQGAPEFAADRLQRLDRHLRDYVDDGRLAGVSAIIAHAGGESYRCHYGYADLQSARKIAPDSLFRIYSMSKPITSVAVLMLFEQGQFLLTDAVSDYLPELGNLQVCVGGTATAPELEPCRQEMTIADLLIHTAGLSYGGDENSVVDQLYSQANLFRYDGTIAEMVQRLGDLPLKHHPGDCWEYSICNDVLGRLVEVVSGMSFDEYLRTALFEPLGMTDTGFEVAPGDQDRLATMYRLGAEGAIEPDDEANTHRFLAPVSFFAGGEGLISTTEDCLRFTRMLLNQGEWDGHRYLSRKTVELMTRNHLTEAQRTAMWIPGYGYGMGVGVLVDAAAHRNLGTVGEYSWAGSGNTYLWVVPEERFCALLFSQFNPSGHYTIAREFKTLMFQALL